MRATKFENFRRFIEFPRLELGEITLMVGANNSGKSTFVKALLLGINYLKNGKLDEFSFSDKFTDTANVATFNRAFCQHQEALQRKTIKFTYELDDFLIVAEISGGEYSIGNVDFLSVYSINGSVLFTFDFANNTLLIRKDAPENDNDNYQEQRITSINDEISHLNSSVKLIETGSKEYFEVVNNIQKLEKLKEKIGEIKESRRDEKYIYNKKITFSDENELANFTMSKAVEEYLSLAKNDKVLINQKIKMETSDLIIDSLKEELETINNVFAQSTELYKVVDEFEEEVSDITYYYWAAEPKKQSALFFARDKENALAQAIHDFYQHKIIKGEYEYSWMMKWMNLFEIGDDINITLHAGEAYEVDIIEDYVKWISLADKGMGSIQVMTLLFRLASIIRKHGKKGKGITLIVEEPELNLHPKLQSLLADLFFEVNKTYGIRFIIETHSEYLIRETQIFVAKENYKDQKDVNENNVFKVYYFPKNGLPYDMEFQTKGKFLNDFEPGFFNVADDSAIELYELNN